MSTIAWICMIVVLNSRMVLFWWSCEVQMKKVDGIGIEWSTSYQNGRTHPNCIRLLLFGSSPQINQQIRQLRSAQISLRSMNPSIGSCACSESYSSLVGKQNKLVTSPYLAKASLHVYNRRRNARRCNADVCQIISQTCFLFLKLTAVSKALNFATLLSFCRDLRASSDSSPTTV
jgi:hypothetical protein